MAINDIPTSGLTPKSIPEILNSSYDPSARMLVVEPMVFDPTANTLGRSYPSNALNLKPYDYVSRSLDTATETWTFKSGGASGTTTNTVVIVYTDTSLSAILSVTKT